MWNAADEAEAARRLGAVLEPFREEPVGRRMRVRLRELGPDCRDEVLHFRVLQRACRESPVLRRALEEAGFEGIADLPTRPPDALAGFLVQAFNRWVRFSGWAE